MVDLRQGDCLQVMKELPDNSIDMILCDLPYGTTRNKNDKRLDFVALWKEYKRIIKDNGCIALFGQGLFYVDLVNSNRKWFRYEWVWDKVLTSGFLNAKRMPLRRHEQDEIEEYFADNLADERDYDLHEGEIEKLVHEQAENLPWVKAIIVYIKLPEV